MLKYLAIFLSCSSLFGQGLAWLSTATKPVVGGDCAESSTIINTNYGNQVSTFGRTLSQSITTAGETICKVSIYARGDTADATVKIQFRTASNGGGSLLCESSEVVIPNGVAAWYDFNISGTLNTGTAYITPVVSANWMKWDYYGSDVYSGGAYYDGTTESPTLDFSFKVWQ